MKTNAGAHRDSSRQYGPLSFQLPASFDPAEFLTEELAMRGDDARWFLSTIIRKTAIEDTDPWGWVRLHSDTLRRVMDARHSAKIIARLRAGGAIESSGYYAGIKAKGYRLTDRFLKDAIVWRPAIDPRLIERVARERARRLAIEQRDRWCPIHYILAEQQQGISLAPEADRLLAMLPGHARLCQSYLIEGIRQRRFSFSVSSTGRVFNAITGVKREIRPTLRFDGVPMGSVDIRCCQPALFAMLNSLNAGHETPSSGTKQRTTYMLPFPLPLFSGCSSPDFSRFASLASSGAFYGELARLSGYELNEVKRRFLIDVLAKHGRYRSEVENTFGAHFPTVLKAIRTVNRDNHAALIRLLQRAESWLVIHRVAPRLIKAGCPVLTLHDAIFTPAQHLPDVEAAFRETLAEIGGSLSLKREMPAQVA